MQWWFRRNGPPRPSTPWSFSFHSFPLQPVCPQPARFDRIRFRFRVGAHGESRERRRLASHLSSPIIPSLFFYPPFSFSLFPRDTPRKNGELSQSACTRLREHRSRCQAPISRYWRSVKYAGCKPGRGRFSAPMPRRGIPLRNEPFRLVRTWLSRPISRKVELNRLADRRARARDGLPAAATAAARRCGFSWIFSEDIAEAQVGAFASERS